MTMYIAMIHKTLSAGALTLGVLGMLAASSPVAACSGSVHLETGPTGIYTVDYAKVAATEPGLADCPIDQLRMTNRGKEVPIRILSDDDSFSAGDTIQWLGYKLHGPDSWSDPYSLVNVYELGAAPGDHARFDARKPDDNASLGAGLSRHVHLEQDRMLMRLTPEQAKASELPDVWYWAKITMIDPEPTKVTFDLPDLNSEFSDPVLTLAFRGWSSLPAHEADESAPVHDHVLEVELNGKPAGTLAWNGNAHVVRDIRLPAGLLQASDNVLTLHVPQRKPAWAKNRLVDIVMFDYLDIDYPVTQPTTRSSNAFTVTTSIKLQGDNAPLLFGSDGVLYQPVAPDEARYASVPTGTRLFPLTPDGQTLSPIGLRKTVYTHDLHNPEHGYEYIIIAHPSLMEAIEPLADFHRLQGMKTTVVNVNAIYDQFNDGIVSPYAIRDMLKHAYDNWPKPRPHYVLLVGDASFDIHDGERSEKFYATFTDRQLLVPGQFLQIPAEEYEDAPENAGARNLIPSFRYYGLEGQSASDNGFVAFDKDSLKPSMAIGRFPVVTPEEVTAIVDKTINYASNPTLGNWRQSVMFITNDDPSFQQTSDQLAADLGKKGFSPIKVYPKAEDKTNEEHEKKIKQAINDGQLLVHFLGHGGRYIWRTGPPNPTKNEDLFTLDDIEALDNSGQLPMVLAMTCYSAPFDNPTMDSIGEKFLREPKNGAIAVFAASWRNYPDKAFSKTLMEQLVTPGLRIGDAILQAKQETSNPDMIGMYNLLGDPAIALQRPRKVMQMAQVGDRWESRVLARVPDVSRFHGTLRLQWLDGTNKIISRHTYRITSPQVRLPEAPEGATAVRVYAMDPTLDTDALGELALQTFVPERPWWMPAPASAKLPPAEDRVFGNTFDG